MRTVSKDDGIVLRFSWAILFLSFFWMPLWFLRIIFSFGGIQPQHSDRKKQSLEPVPHDTYVSKKQEISTLVLKEKESLGEQRVWFLKKKQCSPRPNNLLNEILTFTSDSIIIKYWWVVACDPQKYVRFVIQPRLQRRLEKRISRGSNR